MRFFHFGFEKSAKLQHLDSSLLLVRHCRLDQKSAQSKTETRPSEKRLSESEILAVSDSESSLEIEAIVQYYYSTMKES